MPRRRKARKPMSAEDIVADVLDLFYVEYVRQWVFKVHPDDEHHIRVDFFLPNDRTVIEVDSWQSHQSRGAQDRRRDAWLMRMYGIRTYRIGHRDDSYDEFKRKVMLILSCLGYGVI